MIARRWLRQKQTPGGRPAGPQTAAAPPMAMGSFLIGILLWGAALLLLVGVGPRRMLRMAPGQRAPATLVATVDFETEDGARTEILRHQAADRVLPVFRVDAAAQDAAIRQLNSLFAHLVQLRREAGPEANSNQVARLLGPALDLLGLDVSPSDVLALIPPGREDAVLDALCEALRSVFSRGIAGEEDRRTGFQGVAAHQAIAIRDAEGTLHSPVPLAEVNDPASALEQALKLYRQQVESIKAEETAAAFLKANLLPNLRYDAADTESRRAEAAAAVLPVRLRIRAGETLIEKGERITPDTLARLRAHDRRELEVESKMDRTLRTVGTAGVLLLVLIACAALLRFLQPEILACPGRIGLLAAFILPALVLTRVLFSIAEASGTLVVPVVEYLVPLGFPALCASLYLGVPAALVGGFWTAVAAAFLFDGSLGVAVLALLMTVTTVWLMQDASRRSRLFRAGFWMAVTAILFAVYNAVQVNQAAAVVLRQALAACVCAIGTAIAVLALMPLIELVSGLTSDITLLELSDTRHPLLQRLALEAPGTYHHSLMLAGLAEAAARAIGAHPLWVRVGAYFHDVGKLVKPEFFVENTALRSSPHDALSPGMSRLVIMSHVKEGLRLARQYHLPRPVLDAIEQHHGTALMSFFYQRAVSEGGGAPIQQGEYRYSGPRPRTREQALLSLADAVEAASRTLDRPSPGRLSALVEDVVEARRRDGQLDESNLTLADIAAIKRSFILTLSSMLHGRIKYPENEPASVPSTEGPASGPQGASTPADVADRSDFSNA